MIVATLIGSISSAAGSTSPIAVKGVGGDAVDRLGLSRDVFRCADANGCVLLGTQIIVLRDADEIVVPEQGKTLARFHLVVGSDDEQAIDGLCDDLGAIGGATVKLMPTDQETMSHMSTVRFTSIRQASSPRPGTLAAFLDLPTSSPELPADPLLQPVRLVPGQIAALIREGVLDPAYGTGAKVVRVGNILDPRRYPLALDPGASAESAVGELLAGCENTPTPGPNVFNIVRATSLRVEFGHRKRSNRQISTTFEPTAGLGNPTYARARLAVFAALRGGVAIFADPTAKPDVY